MTNMRKKNHLPLFRDDLSTFDDFFQSTSKNVTKTILETRQNAFGLTESVLVLE